MELHTVNPNDRLPSIVPIRFFINYLHDKDGKVRELETVEWKKIGMNDTTVARIDHLKRDGGPKWAVLSKYYEAWKANEAPPVTGIPLDRWAPVTPDLKKLLNDLLIKTVEDFADINEDVMAKIQAPGIRALRDEARKHLESLKAMSAVHEENKRLKAELDELRAMIEAKPKRGRPPKEVNEPSHTSQ